MWSETYDRDLGDVLKLQTEIATAVAGALKGHSHRDRCVHRGDPARSELRARLCGRSYALASYAADAATGAAIREGFEKAEADARQAIALAPGNTQVLRLSGSFAAYMGHFESGIAALHRAVVLDPLDRRSHTDLGYAFYAARRYRESPRLTQKPSVLIPTTSRPTGSAGSSSTG